MENQLLFKLQLAMLVVVGALPNAAATESLSDRIESVKRMQAYTTDRSCPVKLPPDSAPPGGWSLQEKWVWERTCLGKKAWLDRADLSNPDDLTQVLPDEGTDGHACLPAKRLPAGNRAAPVPAHRHLSADFLRLILTRRPWSEASTTEGVWIECALFTEELDLGKQDIVPEVVLRNTRFEKLVSFFATRFEHSVNLQESVLEQILYADHAEISGGLYLDKGGVYAKVRLVGARIEGGLYANESVFTKAFDADNLSVGEGFYLRGGSFAAIDLPTSKITGQLQLARAHITGEVDLSGSSVQQITLFLPDEQNRPHMKDPIWGEYARIVLRNVKTEALQARLASWKRFAPGGDGAIDEWIEADLTGFRYDRLGGYLGELSDTMIDHPGEELVKWINAVRPATAAQRFDPGPFEQLETALRREGMASKADAVAYAKFERRSAVPPEETTGLIELVTGRPGGSEWWQRNVHWFLSRNLVGYGVYPSRAAYAFVVIILIGTALGWFSSELRRRSVLEKFWYAVDNTVPIVTLDENHKAHVHSPAVTAFYHILKLLGFVLASYLIGALALPGI